MNKVAPLLFCLAALWVARLPAMESEDKQPGKVDVTGAWRVEVEVGGQSGSPVFTLEQEGEKVTGKYQGLLGEAELSGEVSGRKVELAFTTDAGKVVYTGTIDEGVIQGEAKYGDLTGSWTAKKEHDNAKTKSPSGRYSATGIEKTTFEYAARDTGKLHLDRIVDLAVKAPGKRPVIIFLVGGGWEGGGRDDQGLVPGLHQLASRGYTVVSIDYRLGIKIAKARKEMTRTNGVEMYLRAIEWSVEDVFDATSYMVERAEEWRIDKDQIVLLGGSAGATTALVAEFNVANDTDLARAHLPHGFRYAGVISMAGAFWLKADTPLTFKSKPAPIMFFHGAKDQLVTYDEYQGAFSGYGPASYLRKFPGPEFPKWFVDYPQGDHIVAASPFGDCQHEIDAFLQKFVKQRQQSSVHTVVNDKIPKTFGSLILHGERAVMGNDTPAKK
ncbi:MAG: alpha/beta hydrolase [Pirellulales bacterium]